MAQQRRSPVLPSTPEEEIPAPAAERVSTMLLCPLISSRVRWIYGGDRSEVRGSK
ncbi:hypothetical protein PILCRDRAFT_829584 [Piloderma croceum F 1598]|uniref:Uncharacterized protein n=1 Tax=Piloderma croceum (strain F 1598) TaxID=765440 RepID=A0A0C3EJE1_PILCF|nr:hypothetical protein PILCRDRAFT_829584 [Piloderma croceum F 1598]